MRNSLSKMHYLLLVLLLFALAGCGANHSGTSANQSPGQVTAKVQMAKTLQAPASVVTIRLVVTGSGIPTASKDFPAAAGGGTVEVYPGTDLIVTAYGINATGGIDYEGFATKVTVAAGATTNVGTILTSAPIIKAENAPCQSCHQSTRDITGQNLVINYKQSGHYRNVGWPTGLPFNGATEAGCAGCHGTQHNDLTPSASGRCYVCHAANLSLRHTNPSALTAGDANPARYLDLNGTNCSACHEPHNPIKGTGNQERKDWAESGHGDVNALPWVHYDFTTRNICTSCHTAAGFVKAVGNNFTDKNRLSATTLGKQPLTCDGCHSSNDFKNSVRALSSGFNTPYAASAGASTVFPNGAWLGNSQICLPCHSSMGGGKSVESATLTSVSPISHYMAAAATMFVKNGFTAFTSASAPVKVNGSSVSTSASANVPLFTSTGVFRKYTSIPKGYVYTYSNTLTANSDGGAVGSTHRILGTPAMANDSHVGGRPLVSGGPCVVCHMGFGKGNHTWGMSADSFNTVCVNCHDSEGGVALTAANFKTIFIEEQAIPFNNAIKVGFNNLSTNYHIAYNGQTYPYYFKAGSRASLNNDWTLGGTLPTAEARKVAGAAFNLQMLSREPAAFVHARTYARRLLYDSIDFLDNKAMDMSVTSTAMSLYPADYGAAAPADATTATESLKYLKAYNRTSNAWYGSERP